MQSGASLREPSTARMLKRQRTTSNDSVQRKRLLMLDSFDLDSKDAAEHLAETIQKEIEMWMEPTTNGPIGDNRLTSSEWVQDIIGGGDGTPQPQRIARSRVTSSDWVRDYVREGTPLEEGQRCCTLAGFGPLTPTPAIADDEPETLDDATLTVLQTLEEKYPLEKRSPPEKKTEYTDKDVLFGRGGLSNHHVGNKRYRAEADKLKPEYRDVKTTKRHKTVIRNRLVDIVYGYGGRFLQHDDASDSWVEVPLKKARRKASQALREDFKKMA